MKKLILTFVLFGSMTLSNAQVAHVPVGYGVPVHGTSVEIRGVKEECPFPGKEETEGICTVSIFYDTDIFPVHFIQGNDTLEVITTSDSATGLEAIQGVHYTTLPNGSQTYILEVRNSRGGRFIMPEMGND